MFDFIDRVERLIDNVSAYGIGGVGVTLAEDIEDFIDSCEDKLDELNDELNDLIDAIPDRTGPFNHHNIRL